MFAILLLACAGEHSHEHSHTLEDHQHELEDHQHLDTGQDSGEPALHDEAWEELVTYAEGWDDYGYVPGIAFAVVLDGELAYATAMGTTQYGGSSPMTTDTVMRWNSVSKFHTGIALLQAQQDGLVDLHEPVTTYDGGIRLGSGYDPDSLTVHRGMSHTSALPDWWDTNCDESLEAHWDRARWNLHATDSAFFNYSNTGWSLSGHVLEQVTGRDFVEILDEDVLAPAGMETATFDVHRAVEGSYSLGWDGSSFYTPDIHDCGWMRPAGWLHGSVYDLAAMAELLLAGGGDLLDGEDVISALTDEVETFSAPGQTYGYGLYRWNWRGVEAVSHSGSGGGHRSYFLMVPEQDFAVVVATNTTTWSPSYIAQKAMELFVEAPEDSDPELVTDPDTWSDFVGTYYDALWYGEIRVSQDSDQRLYVRFVDGSNTDRRLYQSSTNTFFYVVDGTWTYLRFVPSSEGGEATWLVNRYFVGTRSEGAVELLPPQPADAVVEGEEKLREALPRLPGWPEED